MGESQHLTVPLPLLECLLEHSERAVLWIDPSEAVRPANAAARSLLSADFGRPAKSVRDLLGLGWRELEPIARDGTSDLVVNLRIPRADGSPSARGVRVRLEAVPGQAGRPAAILALLESPTGRSRLSSARDQGLSPDAANPFASIHGSDPRLQHAKQQARCFASTSLPILLVAETGTGIDPIARAIHLASHRATGPFVAINCGGLSPHLLESELFGYGPGAFTGAKREGQDGKVGAADGGTLFLDEVAEMPGALQSLLLRFLEDGTFYRVGENKLRRSDIRLICATCRDLPRLAAEGAFRRDLYYRIKGACITLPALRERNDLAEFAQLLLEDLATSRRMERAPRLTDEALQWIALQQWLGNARELKTALHHALVLADGEILLEHLPVEPSLAISPVEPSTVAAAAPASGRSSDSPVPSLFDAEGRVLRRAIEAAEGNLSAAARTLGVARSTLYRLMERHGLGRPGGKKGIVAEGRGSAG